MSSERESASATGAVPVADPFIPLCVPEMHGNEWQYVKECLDSGWLSSVGAYVERFERLCAGYVGARHGVATSSGTAALHIALLVAGVMPDDEVLVSTLSFIAPANAIRYAGAWPVFIDAEPAYYQMDPQKLSEFLDQKCRWRQGHLWNIATGRRVSAVLPVHILGHPCDLDPLLEAAAKYELAVVEDATESLGAKYRGRPIGGDGLVVCFSFNGNKLITTGGGGMIVTDNERLAARARYLTTQAKDDEVEFVHGAIGFNYRLTNVQAAIGCAQLEQLDRYIQAKRTIASRYETALAGVPGLSVMPEAPWAFAVFWMYTILIEPETYGSDSRALLRRLGDACIQARPLWQPLHLSRPHRSQVRVACPVAERLNRTALSIPSSVGLTVEDQDRVIATIRH
jgi:perosamine synthetase